MKKNIFNLLGGVLLSLPMLFASCGNGDNALEEIINGGGSGSGGGSSTINATAIDLDQKMKVLVKGGDALTITVKFTPSDATDKTVTWESKDPTIATVENGVVTPVGLGITTITAKSGELSATCEVFVGTEVDLSSKGSDYSTNDYDILSGDIGAYFINILDNHHVAFNGMATSKGITCDGDATIILADGSTNTVKGSSYKAGIVVGPSGTTLTIDAETAGDGKLNATGGSQSAGIGTSYNASSDITCGAITIKGGEITAKGGFCGAGIGTGLTILKNYTCGAITINGGTVTATGGYGAAGIGTGEADGRSNTCGVIAITANVTKVTATKGTNSPNSIGKGYNNGGTQNCGTITFGTASVFDGSAWSPATMVAGTYGGLSLAISTTTNADDTWTLTPAE